MNDREIPLPENPQQATDGVTRREFCLKGAAVVGAAAVTLYVPPRLTPVALPAAFAKAAPANKESCEKDPTADKDPGEKDPRDDKAGEKDPIADKDPNEKGDEGAALRTITPPSFAGLKDEWGPA